MVLESVQSVRSVVVFLFVLNHNLFFDLFYQDLVKVFLGIFERNHDKIKKFKSRKKYVITVRFKEISPV